MVDRRRFLATTLTSGAIAGVAGCVSNNPPSTNPEQGGEDNPSSPNTTESSLFNRVELVDTEIVARLNTEMTEDVDTINLIPPDGETEKTDWYGGNSLKVKVVDTVNRVQRPPGDYTLRAVTEFDELVDEHTITLKRSLSVDEIGTYRQLGIKKESSAEELAGCRVVIKNKGPMPVSAFQASFTHPDNEDPIGRTQHGTAVMAGEKLVITHPEIFGFRTRSIAENNRGTVNRDYVVTFHDGTQFRIPVTLHYKGDINYYSAGFFTEFVYFSEMEVTLNN